VRVRMIRRGKRLSRFGVLYSHRRMGYLSAQAEYNEVVGDYRKADIRNRRAGLALNTAVGNRVMPEPR
jgi:hypothetical protein